MQLLWMPVLAWRQAALNMILIIAAIPAWIIADSALQICSIVTTELLLFAVYRKVVGIGGS